MAGAPLPSPDHEQFIQRHGPRHAAHESGQPVSGLYDFAREGGADVQKQQNKSERYRTKYRIRQLQSRDQPFDFDTYGAYVQAEISPTSAAH
jgi:hypothetical protein